MLLALLALLALLTSSAGAGRLRGDDERKTGPALVVGMRVLVHGKLQGVLRFAGRTAFGDPKITRWYGIELDDPVGKNDGSVNGVRYFKAASKHGLFTLPSNAMPLTAAVAAGALAMGHPAHSAAPDRPASATSAPAPAAAAGDMASASSVMRAVSAAAKAEGDPTPTPPPEEGNAHAEETMRQETTPLTDTTTNTTTSTSTTRPPPPSVSDPRDVPFRVSSASDYLSALDSRIHKMEKQHEEASALAHAQEAVLKKTAAVSIPPQPAFRPRVDEDIGLFNDPSRLAKENLQLDTQIKNMNRRLSKLKGQ